MAKYNILGKGQTGQEAEADLTVSYGTINKVLAQAAAPSLTEDNKVGGLEYSVTGAIEGELPQDWKKATRVTYAGTEGFDPLVSKVKRHFGSKQPYGIGFLATQAYELSDEQTNALAKQVGSGPAAVGDDEPASEYDGLGGF